MGFRESFINYLAAAYPAFYVTTHEESRAVTDITAVAVATSRPLAFWTVTQGWLDPTGKVIAPAKDAKAAIEAVMQFPQDTIAVLKDFHPAPMIGNALIVRMLRDVLPALKAHAKPLVFLSPVANIPVELEKDITVLDYALPNREDLGRIFDEVVKAAEVEKGKCDVPDRTAVLEAARGLTASEAENAFSLAWVKHGTFGNGAIRTVQTEKAQAIKKSGLVSWVEAEQRVDDIGGLENLKAYIRMIAPTFHHPDKAEVFGMRPEDFPRSILLVGPPGTGKSMVAKAIAGVLKTGCIQTDFGRLFGGVVGASESNTRRRNELAEAVAPVVDWWDEAEKGLAGVKGSDQNPWEARVGGSMLTWMEEHRARVLIVGTVNRFDAMPPEMVSRFQKVFLVDLPTSVERREIFAIHTRMRSIKMSSTDLGILANATDGYSGREIRNAVQASMQAVFAKTQESGDTPVVDVDDILAAAKTITPVSKSRKDEIERMRSWAKEFDIPSASADMAIEAPTGRKFRRR